MEQKPHIAILASPGMGHLIPLVEFAKLLVHHHDLHVTCIIPVLGSPSKAMKAVLQALPTTIDHVFLPPMILEKEEIKGLKFEIQTILTLTRSLPPLRDVLKSTRFSAFVVDPFGIDALDIAKELNISPYIFFHANAFTLSLVFHLTKLDKTVSCECRDLPEPLKLPGCIPIHGRDLMEPVQDRTSESHKMILHSAKQFRLAEGIIINTYMELEGSAIKALLDEEAKNLPLYPVGPIQSGSSNQWWTLSYEQTNELALGLELSGQKFLWVVRTPNNESADATYHSDQTLDNNPLAFLPKGFVERTKWQGLVVPSWAPQAQALSHGSTGGFLTHCGWNSTLESIMQGIPLIAWPLYAEQKMNAVLLAEDVKVALRPKTNKNDLIDREEIAKVVKGLLVGEEGKKVRNRMKDIKIAAEKALTAEGSSTKALSELASQWTNHPGF
uniref:Glycosyltransferase n=1 Tax=Quercus lobata TaxID=97700 RepID=A0A7N2LGF0_QUELO